MIIHEYKRITSEIKHQAVIITVLIIRFITFFSFKHQNSCINLTFLIKKNVYCVKF